MIKPFYERVTHDGNWIVSESRLLLSGGPFYTKSDRMIRLDRGNPDKWRDKKKIKKIVASLKALSFSFKW